MVITPVLVIWHLFCFIEVYLVCTILNLEIISSLMILSLNSIVVKRLIRIDTLDKLVDLLRVN